MWSRSLNHPGQDGMVLEVIKSTEKTGPDIPLGSRSCFLDPDFLGYVFLCSACFSSVFWALFFLHLPFTALFRFWFAVFPDDSRSVWGQAYHLSLIHI